MIQNYCFLTVYEKMDNKYCTNKANDVQNVYETLELAIDACSTESDCEMLYDYYGKGQSFVLCNRPTEMETSSWGSIVYIKPGRKYICTRTNSMGIP